MSHCRHVRRGQLLAAILVAANSVARATTTYWAADPSVANDWFDASAWSMGLPSSSLGATIDNGGQVTLSYGTAAANGVQVGSTAGGTITISGGQLTSGPFLVWPGLVNQTGGDVHASMLEVGASFSGGVYQLSGTGQLSVDQDESIDNQFIQSGGNNNAETMSIGNGSYHLIDGELETYNGETIGSGISVQETAEFIQSGGVNYLGNGGISILDIVQGSYQLNGGELSAAQISFTTTPFSGTPGNGAFLQTGGIVSVGSINLSASTYTMTGGTFTVTSKTTSLNNSQGGIFSQNGGICAFGTLEISGSYVLGPNGTLQAHAEYVGYSGTSTFTQTGGMNITGSLTLAYENSTGSYSLLSGANLQCGNEYVGNGGVGIATFTQTDSTNNLTGFNLYVGDGVWEASYSMSGSSQIWAYNEYIGYNVYSSASFTQNGGTNNLAGGTLTLGYGGGNSNYLLKAGTVLAQNELVSSPGAALFDQTGGSNTTSSLTINSAGRYNLLSGILQVTTSFVNSGAFDLQNPAAAGLSGTNILTLAPLPITGTGTLIVEQNAALYAASITQGSLLIGGKIQIVPGSATSKINSLTITTGTLDITNNALIIDYAAAGPSPLSSIRSYLYSGSATKQNGPGIISSTTLGDSAVAIGYAEAASLGVTSFGGIAVDSTAVLIRYTWMGDANLDGIVNAADLGMIQSTGTSWSAGDFNYDGIVNADDYALFNLGSAESGGNAIPLPEPAFIAFLAIPFLRRRAIPTFRQ